MSKVLRFFLILVFMACRQLNLIRTRDSWYRSRNLLDVKSQENFHRLDLGVPLFHSNKGRIAVDTGQIQSAC